MAFLKKTSSNDVAFFIQRMHKLHLDFLSTSMLLMDKKGRLSIAMVQMRIAKQDPFLKTCH